MMTRTRLVVLLKSKTVWGSIIAALAWLIQQPTINAATAVQAFGMVLSAAGVRDAITQAFGATDAPPAT